MPNEVHLIGQPDFLKDDVLPIARNGQAAIHDHPAMTVHANERSLLGCSVIASKREIAVPDLAFDLRYLKYAMLAAEHGSFRRAAEISQPFAIDCRSEKSGCSRRALGTSSKKKLQDDVDFRQARSSSR